MNPDLLMSLPAWRACGWTILHFAWVGTAIGLACLLLRRLVRRAAPEIRYAVALCGLLALAVAPAAIAWTIAPTLRDQAPHIDRAAKTVAFAPPSGHRPRADFALPRAVVNVSPRSLLDRLDDLAKYLPWAWLAGVSLTLALLAGGLVGAERLRLDCRVLTEGEHVDRLARLAAEIGIKGRVSLALCDRLAAPLLLGIARPLIALPLVALAGWSPGQLEMVLLHELAHVRRRDNLVNVFQRLVESLLFFHPAVWWASAWVRAEREHCCDALVIARTGRPRAYAEVLLALAPVAAPRPFSSPLACRINESPLVHRVRRILNLPEASMSPLRLASALALAALVTPLSLFAFAGPDEPVKPATLKISDADIQWMRDTLDTLTTPDRHSIAMANVARVEFVSGRTDEARATFLKARDEAARIKTGEGSFSPHPLFWIARVQESTGDRAGALETYRTEARVAQTTSIKNFTGRPHSRGNMNEFTNIFIEQLKLGAVDEARGTIAAAEQFEATLTVADFKTIRPPSEGFELQLLALAGDFDAVLRWTPKHDNPGYLPLNLGRTVLTAYAKGIKSPEQRVAALKLAPLLAALPKKVQPENTGTSEADADFSAAHEVALAQARAGLFDEALATAGALDDDEASSPGQLANMRRFNKTESFQKIAVELFKAGQTDRARIVFDKAATMAESIPDTSYTQTRLFWIANDQIELGDYVGAERTIGRNKPNVEVGLFIQMAYSRARRGEADAAVADFRRARIEMEKGVKPWSIRERVLIARGLGEIDEANRLVESLPGNPATPAGKDKSNELTDVAIAAAVKGDMGPARVLAGQLKGSPEQSTLLLMAVSRALAEKTKASPTGPR
jgi:beta-lactamase regulating signal transducer with metallopeptidase domain/tetratricopeptide (TPR) repeat protein